MPPVREIAVFGGSSHPELTAEICAHLRVPQRPVLLKRFANDCLEVQLQSNCRERDVFIIQSLVRPVQENLVELLLMADAARGASAARVNAEFRAALAAVPARRLLLALARGRPPR